MILVLDNYDSFTWNIVHYLRELGAQVRVERNDALTAAEALATGAAGFLISPGPGRPEAAGESLALVAACAEARRPLLGICLGHQAVALHFGASVVRADSVMHGKTCAVRHDGTGLFEDLPSPLIAARYHSLTVEPGSVPDCLAANALADDGTVQGLRHRDLPIHAVQFHPESVASEEGHRLLRNFIGIAQRSASA
ncbi:MAG TPA: aminodeoxychorismate/anthranilate synthase component II [Allosphingosinicella sp.]|nr:aminodeoxychorismate/anthranilate synthase component II [Allosphingosinicella sp.]